MHGFDFLFQTVAGVPAWTWVAFFAVVTLLLAFDLGILHKEDKEIGIRESLFLSTGYILAAVIFGGWVWWFFGPEDGMHYYTGFLIEKSLSMDNIFVIALIFTFFGIPRKYQHRVLFWGIMGVIVLRAIMIGVGAGLIHEFEWILYVFGAFLVFTGVKMWFMVDHTPDISKNPLLKIIRRCIPFTDNLRGNDPFIVYTSNIFAILGLRALYFALAAIIHRFHYLKYALALILVFIGGKVFLVNIIGKVPPSISLSVTVGLLAGGVVLSLYKTAGSKTHA